MTCLKSEEKRRIQEGISSIFKGKKKDSKEMKMIQMSESLKSSNSSSPKSNYVQHDNSIKDNKVINDVSIHEQNTVLDSSVNEKHIDIQLLPKGSFKNFNKNDVFDEKFHESGIDEAL